jgi:crotonobetainyl-CoA:carnitine CoA-transferase CaiB-like acyl-CoA transferase
MSGLAPKRSQDEILGLEDAPDPFTFMSMPPEEREVINRRRREAFKHHDRAELVAEFQANNHAIEPIITMEDALADPHPQLAANGMVAEIDDPELGRTTQIGVPINLFGTPGAILGPQPRVGEHNAEIWGELGYAPDDLAAVTGGS